MASEWVCNLSITSKVDVYSYGIVVLEMITGKGPSSSIHAIHDGVEAKHRLQILSLEEIIDPMLEGKYDMDKMETLVWVSLQCVKEDKDERPTMSQVVEMLLSHENYKIHLVLSYGVIQIRAKSIDSIPQANLSKRYQNNLSYYWIL